MYIFRKSSSAIFMFDLWSAKMHILTFESVSDHHIIVVSMCVVVALVLVNVVHKLGTKVYCRCIPMAQRIQIFQ